jgi:hypothetical protein
LIKLVEKHGVLMRCGAENRHTPTPPRDILRDIKAAVATTIVMIAHEAGGTIRTLKAGPLR